MHARHLIRRIAEAASLSCAALFADATPTSNAPAMHSAGYAQALQVACRTQHPAVPSRCKSGAPKVISRGWPEAANWAVRHSQQLVTSLCWRNAKLLP